MNEQKRLLIVTDYYSPHWTGLVKSLAALVGMLSNECSITVLTTKYDASLPKEEYLDGALVIRAEPFLNVSRARWSVQMIQKAAFLMPKTDIVLLNTPFSNILPIAILAKIFRKKLFLFHQGDLNLPAGILNRIVECLFECCTVCAGYLTDKVSTYTDDYGVHSRIIRPFQKKFFPVRLPVVIADAKQQVGISLPVGNPTLGFAGRFVEEKGFDTLFEAMPLILKKFPNAKFIFAGETNIHYENFFKQVCDRFPSLIDSVTWCGLLNPEELRAFYEHIDFIVVPSRSDSFNLVQAEAALCGTPAIVADVPGLRAFVSETGFGVLFEKENPTALCQAITEAVSQQKEILSRSERVREYLDIPSCLQQARIFLEINS